MVRFLAAPVHIPKYSWEGYFAVEGRPCMNGNANVLKRFECLA